MCSPALIALHELAHSTLLTAPGGKCYNYPHFTDDKIIISFKGQTVPIGNTSPKY